MNSQTAIDVPPKSLAVSVPLSPFGCQFVN